MAERPPNRLDETGSHRSADSPQTVPRLRRLSSAHYLAICGLILLLVAASASSQNSRELHDEAAPTRQLLEEVRLLRQALEHSQQSIPAFQLLLERTRFQTELVSRLDQRVNEVRIEMEQARIETEQTARQTEELKQQPPADPELRASYDDQLKELQLQTLRQKQLQDFYHQEQDRLALQLSQEQAKLDQLNAQLNQLQAELTARPHPAR